MTKPARLIRSLHKGMNGPDVLAVKRALKAAGYGRGLILNRVFGAGLYRQLRKFQEAEHLQADGVYGPKTHAKLWPRFDAYGQKLLGEAPKQNPHEETFSKLLSYMHQMTLETPGYLFGGGHGIPMADVRIDRPLDCSSSTSKALWKVGLFTQPEAWVSGEFADSYGLPGTGRFFTIHANSDHVWIRLYRGGWWRFDTSPYNDGGFGPRLRKLPRPTFGFVQRHAKGF